MEIKMPTETDAITPKKIVIVTGSSRGIGRNTAESLARRGVNSIFTYHTHGEDAEAVVAAVKDALSKLGAARFDFLVNNAGNSHRNMPFETATEEELDSIYNVHFKGVFFLTQKLLPLINDGGQIVNVSTARTRIAGPGCSVYAMKGAVEVLSKHMAKELGPRSIAVNVVAPGATETDFSGGIVRDNPAVNKRVAEGTALGRASVPDDVGRMIASLLSEEVLHCSL
jgi:NAD(P)-dependent dehydrogenase (short-subunit alcohol dehydrogenase family)